MIAASSAWKPYVACGAKTIYLSPIGARQVPAAALP
jgi:hypothetical protein